ncbi:MAG TPA: SMP-30/gluconolactonase/LRE family protein [Polyangia bacterium]|nr:SMP-30/gluconolactonase/LRE family protein [Polyangia bacterium]
MPSAPRFAALLLVLDGILGACSSEPSRGASGASGGSGLAGGSGSGGSAGSGSGGVAGAEDAAVADTASGGGDVASATGGSGGSADASDAPTVGSGDGGVDAVSGSGFWGPNGPKKQFTCPPGPYPAQMVGASTEVCVGFKYNYSYNEGPTWIASENAFFFSNFVIYQPTGGDIIKYTPGGGCEVWLHDVGCNGLGVSPSGNLLGACHGPRAVMEYDVKTKVGRKVATTANGKMFDAPNDLIARSDGNVYFSNRTAENGNRPIGLGEALVRIDPMGVTSVIQMGGLNGVALSPDETKLHVVTMGTWTLNTAGVPGQKGGPTPGGDGIAVDCAGSITNNGTNSAFGGPDGKTLFIVAGTRARTVAVTVPGLP